MEAHLHQFELVMLSSSQSRQPDGGHFETSRLRWRWSGYTGVDQFLFHRVHTRPSVRVWHFRLSSDICAGTSAKIYLLLRSPHGTKWSRVSSQSWTHYICYLMTTFTVSPLHGQVVRCVYLCKPYANRDASFEGQGDVMNSSSDSHTRCPLARKLAVDVPLVTSPVDRVGLI